MKKMRNSARNREVKMSENEIDPIGRERGKVEREEKKGQRTGKRIGVTVRLKGGRK